MIQNLSETKFYYVTKLVLTQQLLESLHLFLLRESGDVYVLRRVYCWLKVLLALWLNVQQVSVMRSVRVCVWVCVCGILFTFFF